MKVFQILLAFLLLTAPLARGQTTVTFPSGKIATEEYVRNYVDSVLGKPTPPIFSPCDEGPTLRTITNITENSLVASFHGKNVFGIDWQIVGDKGVVEMGSIRPTSSSLAIRYKALPPGTYTLKLFGNTCQGKSEKEFRIKDKSTGHVPPIPPANGRLDGTGNHELFMNLTGYGFAPEHEHGINPEWVERIEAFRYSWGWGITGIRLCVRWFEWEPQPGAYSQAGLQKVIEYCQARGLKLSVHFWPYQRVSFIPDGHAMQGHRGSYYEFEQGTRMGSLASPVVNRKIYDAVSVLARQLASYEGGYYVSLGTADAEEYTNPVIRIGQPGGEITGFEPVFQQGFREFRQAKNRPYQLPEIREWENGAALAMGHEIGRDFARFVSLSLTRYYENFARAVKEGGGGKLLACYAYPDAGNPQNQWYLHANFAAQAASADAMFGTDGINQDDNDRKLLCNAINLGMGKISIVEYDPVDLGEKGGYCTQLNNGQLEREFRRAYEAGGQAISLSMAYCPDQIRSFDQPLRNLRAYIGKPYTRPDRPTTAVPIVPAFWNGQEIYAPHWTGFNYLRPDDSDFWGSPRKD